MRAPKDDDSRKLCRAARLYRLLLFFYPARFRRKFGTEMLRLFKDQWREVPSGRSTLHRIRFWLWLCADTGWSAGREHLSAMNQSIPMRTSSRRLLPGLTVFFLTSVIGFLYSLRTLQPIVDSLSPRQVVFASHSAGFYFPLFFAFGLGLLTSLPFLLPRIAPYNTGNLTRRTSFWLVTATACLLLATIGCALAVRATPPNLVIASNTLSWACLIPACLLLLLAAYTALILRTAHPRTTPSEAN
jgi:uncharacterized membrane protein YhaH (DUF805 family)